MQQTLQNSVTLEGIGIHSGNPVSCILRPAPEPNYGIRFIRTDCQHFELKVSPDYLLTYQRATCLGKHNIYINKRMSPRLYSKEGGKNKETPMLNIK